MQPDLADAFVYNLAFMLKNENPLPPVPRRKRQKTYGVVGGEKCEVVEN